MSEEEKQELETLRREKTAREQTERARTALDTAGVPAEFAALLIGGDDGDTDGRVGTFVKTYQAALSQDVRSRLPEKSPVVTPPGPQRAKRGIQRLR
ncbi:MAG: DUF4355 domain-containing protein [Oscillibacter sp.]|jgi:hypothetical protein|nr:DUF4355 domain-containing protein [Oscillibacter sp.]